MGTYHPLHWMDCLVVFKQYFTNTGPSSFVIVNPEVEYVALSLKVQFCSIAWNIRPQVCWEEARCLGRPPPASTCLKARLGRLPPPTAPLSPSSWRTGHSPPPRTRWGERPTAPPPPPCCYSHMGSSSSHRGQWTGRDGNRDRSGNEPTCHWRRLVLTWSRQRCKRGRKDWEAEKVPGWVLSSHSLRWQRWVVDRPGEDKELYRLIFLLGFP